MHPWPSHSVLTRKDKPFIWSDQCDLSFLTLKEEVKKQLKLHIFQPDALTYVTTDASDVGLGATLTQLQNGKIHPIAYFNKTLSAAERNYAENEKEALAVLFALEHWEKILLGRRFTIRIDHQSLLTLLSSPMSKRQSAKFERWKDRLSHFSYDIEYIPGPQKETADSLSRLQKRA